MSDLVKIMIVEDESIVALDLATGLERDRYVVTGIADSYEEAMELFNEQEPYILLMDINHRGKKTAWIPPPP